jgi:hypothetical protein
VGVKGGLDAPHDASRAGAPLQLNKRRHVAPRAVLTLRTQHPRTRTRLTCYQLCYQIHTTSTCLYSCLLLMQCWRPYLVFCQEAVQHTQAGAASRILCTAACRIKWKIDLLQPLPSPW